MPSRKRRLLVGSLSSLLWPAVVVLIPAGITFAAARVYAEGAPPPPKCESQAVSACTGKVTAQECGFGYYGGGKGICFPWSCIDDAGDASPGQTCVDVQFCRDVSDEDCRSKTLDAGCNNGSGTCQSVRGMTNEPQSECYESDAGIAVKSVLLKCIANGTASSSSGSSGASSSSGDNGGTSGTFVPGPDTVPGSSSSSGSTEDSGCSTTSSNGTTLPLLGAPLAIGLLLALRKKRRRD